jgi:hypothetical protein
MSSTKPASTGKLSRTLTSRNGQMAAVLLSSLSEISCDGLFVPLHLESGDGSSAARRLAGAILFRRALDLQSSMASSNSREP